MKYNDPQFLEGRQPEFKRLMKMGVLGEPYKQKRTIEVTIYDFIVD